MGFVAYYSVPKRLRPVGWPATYTFGPVRTSKERDAAIQWALDLGKKLDAQRLGIHEGPASGSIPHLIKTIEADQADLYRWSTLSENSRKTYRRAFKVLRSWSASIGDPPASQLTPQGVHNLYSQTGDKPHMRKLIAAALSKLLDVAVAEGLAARNFVRDMPSPPAKRAEAKQADIWPEEYFKSLLQHALKKKEWSLARMLAFQRYYAQRPSDAIRLHTDWIKGGWIEFHQQKTGAEIRLPMDLEFKEVMDKTPTQIGPLALNGADPHNLKSYRMALYALQNDLGLPNRPPKHLRHTGVLEMARASLTSLQISQRTGHAPTNVNNIISHYLPQDDVMKDAASAQIERYRRNRS